MRFVAVHRQPQDGELANSGSRQWASKLLLIRIGHLTVGCLCSHPGVCRLQALPLLLQDVQLDDLEGLVVMWDGPGAAKPAGAALADSARPCPVCCRLVGLTRKLDLYAAKPAANTDCH